MIGKSITLNRTNYTVVGVVDSAPLRTLGPRNAELWIPLERAVPYTQRGTHFLRVIARLKPGVGVEQARSDLKVLAHRLDAQYKTGHGITLAPLREQLFGNVRLGLLLLLGAAGFPVADCDRQRREHSAGQGFGARQGVRHSSSVGGRPRASDFPNPGREPLAFFARRRCWFSGRAVGLGLAAAGLAALHPPARELRSRLASAVVSGIGFTPLRGIVRLGAGVADFDVGAERNVERRLVATERLGSQPAAQRVSGFPDRRRRAAIGRIGIVAAQLRPSPGGRPWVSRRERPDHGHFPPVVKIQNGPADRRVLRQSDRTDSQPSRNIVGRRHHQSAAWRWRHERRFPDPGPHLPAPPGTDC